MTIYFTCPLHHGMENLHMVPPPPCHPLLRPWWLSLGTYNIRDIRDFIRAQAIWAVHLGNFDVMVMTETNITRKAYFRNRLGYEIVCFQDVTTDTGSMQEGVGLFIRERPH